MTETWGRDGEEDEVWTLCSKCNELAKFALYVVGKGVVCEKCQ